MSDYSKIVPAVSALDRALESAALLPLDRCLPGGAAGIRQVTDDLGALVLEMSLSPLSEGEAQTFSGWTGEDVLSQALEVPLGACPTVQAAAPAQPEEAAELRGSLSEMVRVQEAARLFVVGARGGVRFVQGLLAFACLRLVDSLEAGGGRGAEEQAGVLADTAALRARVRALRERQEAARAREGARLQPLRDAAEGAESDARDAEALGDTLAAVRRGETPPDEQLLSAAARLGQGPAALKPAANPAPKDRRRKDR